MKCRRCQHENPSEARFCMACGAGLGARTKRRKAEAVLRGRRKPSKSEGPEVHDLEKRLAEALDQQTAASEILRVISSSPTDVQPVFDAIVRSAVRLCDGLHGVVDRFDGELIHFAAQYNYTPEALQMTQRMYPRQPDRKQAAGRAILTGDVVNIADVQADPEYATDLAVAGGWRSILNVPMLREGKPIGTIGVIRGQAGRFSDAQVELLRTFAAQAVIAIENVRLFTALQEKNTALTQAHAQVTEALEQQTATAEILRVISRSPTDIQPVFDVIVENACRLCDGVFANAVRFDGALMHNMAHYGFSPEAREMLLRAFPQRPSRESMSGRAILNRGVVQSEDMSTDVETTLSHQLSQLMGFRAQVSVPMLREGIPIGTITVARRERGLFPERQVDLLRTFADQAVIAIENVRLFKELQASNRELTTALDKQTATSDILRVISQSQTDVQPVFDAILSSALRLMGAHAGVLTRVMGDYIDLVAFMSIDNGGAATVRAAFPLSLQDEGAHAKAIRDRAPVNIAHAQTDPQVTERGHSIARAVGYESMVAVPMLRHDAAVGTISATRREPGGFTEDEIALLQTFADQAVIAIENVRLFTELEERNKALTESLDQQTATSEILRVISSSPTDVQPVFDAIIRNAVRLCNAARGTVYRFDGELMHIGAQVGYTDEQVAVFRSGFPRRPGDDSPPGRAVLTRAIAHIPDPPQTVGFWGVQQGSTVAVPLIREGVPIGALGLSRIEIRAYGDAEIELLKTFADQAVIAIENVRLFKELESSNRELRVALEQQTATSEILRTIAHVQTDAQPVFDTIVQSAARLCHAAVTGLFLTDGQMVYLPANYGSSPETLAVNRARFPRPLDMDTPPGVAMLTRSVIHVSDTEEPSAMEYVRQAGRLLGFRSGVTVPMLREGEAVGAISVTRREPGHFSDAEVGLLKTFADQAVIAVENVRLFKELEARTADLTRSVEQLTALGEVGRAVSSTLDVETVLTTIVSRAVELSGLDGGVVFEYDERAEEFVQRAMTDTGEALAEARRATRIRKGEGVLGRTAITLEPVQVADIDMSGAYEGRLRDVLLASGIRAILAVPMVREGHLIGCLGVTRNHPGEFAAETIDLLRTFATQSALAIQNARLFREIEQKSRELEAASRHKSEFLANMSHELRTPLNAVIGFSEVLTERMFGELNERQDEYLKDIHASGQHLLSLINDILDLSKIEAGRMELEVTDFDLPMAIDNAMTLVRERAARRSIALRATVDERLGQVQGDERKIRQVLLNLLSNAIKFTPEGGRIDVHAVPKDGMVEVSVTDTGVGIASEDQEAVFEEFRQVGTADKKVEGTGLGLALSRKFIELHGGRIWVKSQVGAGSIFTFTVPVRSAE